MYCARVSTLLFAGWLYDVTGSYNLSFHVAGIPIIFGAILLFFIPWAQRTSHTTNVMTAVQSSDDVEGIAANDGADANNVEWTNHYLLKDHLGSTDVVIGQSVGNFRDEQLLSYDPWGKRRDAVAWDGKLEPIDWQKHVARHRLLAIPGDAKPIAIRFGLALTGVKALMQQRLARRCDDLLQEDRLAKISRPATHRGSYPRLCVRS